MLLDLDGTLLDTRPGIRAALGAAFLEVLGGTQLPAEPDWSLPIAAVVEKLLPDVSPAEREGIVAAFRRSYDGGLWADAVAFPNAGSSIAALHAAGWRLFVVTNKRRAAAEALLGHFGLAPYLEGVVAQDDLGEAVPKLVLADRCLEAAGLTPDEAVVVGDSDHDAYVAAARAMPFVAVTSGTGPLSGGRDGPERVSVVSLADAVSYLLHSSGRAL